MLNVEVWRCCNVYIDWATEGLYCGRARKCPKAVNFQFQDIVISGASAWDRIADAVGKDQQIAELDWAVTRLQKHVRYVYVEYTRCSTPMD